MAQSRISDLTAGTPPVPGTSLFEVSVVNAGASSGYDSRRFTLSDIFGSYFPLIPTNGGTGINAYQQGDLLYASATNVLSRLAKDASGTRYLGNSGTNSGPAWSQINLTNGVTGILPVANGGTGAASFPVPNIWSFDSLLLRGQGTNPISTTYVSGGIIGIWNSNSLGCIAASTVGESGIDFGRSRGTITAPSAVLSGDYLGSLWFDGYGATRWCDVSRAQISAITTQNWTDTAQGSSFHFMVTPSGTVGVQDIMQLDGSGLHLSNNISVIDAIPATASTGTITSHHLTTWELNFNLFDAPTAPLRQNAGYGANLWFDSAEGKLWYTIMPNGPAGQAVSWYDCPVLLTLNYLGVLSLSHVGVNPINGYGAPGGILLSYANGTQAAPTAVTMGNWVGMVGGTGHNGTAIQDQDWPIMLAFVASENWTPTANGAQFEIWTTPNGAPASTGNFQALLLDCYGNLIIAGATATKPGGGSWSAPSEHSLKSKTDKWSVGLDAILALNPISYRYNDERWNIPQDYIGLDADEASSTIPEMLREVLLYRPVEGAEKVDRAKRNENFQAKALDHTPVVFALVNACKELASRVMELENRLGIA